MTTTDPGGYATMTVRSGVEVPDFQPTTATPAPECLMTLRSMFLAGCIGVAGSVHATDAGAQVGVPGLRIEAEHLYRARIRAEMYRSVSEFFADWRKAWNDQNVSALTRLYAEDALVRLPARTTLLRGREELRASLEAVFESAGDMTMTYVDFESNGEVSIFIARYTLNENGRLVEGMMTTVLFGSGRSWRVRAQMFDSEAAPAAELRSGELTGASLLSTLQPRAR